MINGISGGNNYTVYSDYRYTNSFIASGASKNGGFGYNAANVKIWGGSQSTGANIFSSVTTLKTSSLSFKQSVSALTSKANSGVFSQRSAVSSNTDVLSAKYDAKQAGAAAPKPVSVKVDQLATAQKNEGKTMASNEKNIAAGTYSFALEAGGKKYTVSVNITDKDTNESALKKAADALNAKNTGVRASVVTDAAKKTSRLVLESASTGVKGEGDVFTVYDISAPGANTGIIETADANNATQKAQNALYSVNGGAQKSSLTNEISLGSGISATLRSVSDKPVSVSIASDTEAITKSVLDFAYNYNSMLLLSTESGFGKIESTLGLAVNSSRASLAKAGITFGEYGEMDVDTSKLAKAIDNGSLEKLFNDRASYSFGSRIQSAADAIARNPMRYTNIGAQLSLYSMQSSMDSYFASMYSGQLFNLMI